MNHSHSFEIHRRMNRTSENQNQAMISSLLGRLLWTTCAYLSWSVFLPFAFHLAADCIRPPHPGWKWHAFPNFTFCLPCSCPISAGLTTLLRVGDLVQYRHFYCRLATWSGCSWTRSAFLVSGWVAQVVTPIYLQICRQFRSISTRKAGVNSPF